MPSFPALLKFFLKYLKRIGRMVKKIKRFTDLPVAVGFGVSTPEQAENIAKHSDGIIVGSAIVKIIEKSGQNKKRLVKDVGNFIGELKSAISPTNRQKI